MGPQGLQPNAPEVQFPGTQPAMGATPALGRAPQMPLGVEGGMPEGLQPNVPEAQFPGTAQPPTGATPALGRVPQRTPGVEGGMPQGLQPNAPEVQFPGPTAQENQLPGRAQPAMGATPQLGRTPQVTPDVEGGMPEGWPLVTGGSEDSDKVSRVLDFLDFVGQLKEVKRAGWVRSGVDGAESVADHTYSMTSMCLVLNPADGVDQTKCMKMALVNDLGVSITGDVVTAGLKPDNITREEKFRKEQEAIHTVASKLGGVTGAEIVSLWKELQVGVTPEALYVRDMNKLDMVMQADTYEQTQAVQLDDFFNTTSNVFKTSLFQSLDAEVRTRRADRSADRSRLSRDRLQY